MTILFLLLALAASDATIVSSTVVSVDRTARTITLRDQGASATRTLPFARTAAAGIARFAPGTEVLVTMKDDVVVAIKRTSPRAPRGTVSPVPQAQPVPQLPPGSRSPQNRNVPQLPPGADPPQGRAVPQAAPASPSPAQSPVAVSPRPAVSPVTGPSPRPVPTPRPVVLPSNPPPSSSPEPAPRQ